MKISGKKGMDDELTTEVTNSNSSMMYKMTYGKSLLAIIGLLDWTQYGWLNLCTQILELHKQNLYKMGGVSQN